MYEAFQILLDDPAVEPGLGFADAADALSEILLLSRPQFAIGIFGVWGSGKTTLMQAINERITSCPTAVSVWFNAWRYEREEHLIVPLLDTIREGLLTWASEHGDNDDATKAAATVGKAARAILAGFSLTASLPGVALALDTSKAVSEWRASSKRSDRAFATESQSFYHASFRALQDSLGRFVGGNRPSRRIIVFVDDLDRCLPVNALEVLESMKLFFDSPGFVFVVGLDEGVIERAIAAKYSSLQHGSEAPFVAGIDYVKKIFQVQFSVPRMVEDQLNALVGLVTKDLPAEQKNEIDGVVRPHLRYLTLDGWVNPREIKRFINDYTVLMKMLEKRLARTTPTPSIPVPSVVLTVQTMAFRSEWRPLYDQLTLDPSEFQAALKDCMSSPNLQGGVLQLGTRQVPLPSSFVRYVRAIGRAILEEPLDLYVSSIEATRPTDRRVVEARRALRDLRLLIGRLESGHAADRSELLGLMARLYDTVASTLRVTPSHNDVMNQMSELVKGAENAQSLEGSAFSDWTGRVSTGLDAVDEYLRDLQRQLTGLSSSV